MKKYKFSKFGSVLLPINIKPLDDTVMSETYFKVDTGADSTTTSKSILYANGYDYYWIESNIINRGTVITATGDKILSAVIQIPLINILGYEAKNWPFTILLDEDKDLKNLLGRDLLTGFNYSFK